MKQRILDLLKDTATSVWITFAVMWPLGAILVALGWLGDSTHYWSERPFLTNLTSSLAGAMFGIPIALVVIQKISAQQAAHMANRSVLRQAARSATELKLTLEEIAKGSPERLTEAEESLRRVRDMMEPLDNRNNVPDDVLDELRAALTRVEQSLVSQGEFKLLWEKALIQMSRVYAARTLAFEVEAPWADTLMKVELPTEATYGYGTWPHRTLHHATRPAVGVTFAKDSESPAGKSLIYLEMGIGEVADLRRSIVGTTAAAAILTDLAKHS